MNRLCPAETRLKEGANAHDSDQNRWECSLAAGWWRPVSALPPVSRDCRFDVKRAEVGAVSLEARQPSVRVISETPMWTHAASGAQRQDSEVAGHRNEGVAGQDGVRVLLRGGIWAIRD
jgi:hypothetical protein